MNRTDPDMASAIAAIDTLLRSVEAGWIPASRKVRAARRALEQLTATVETDSASNP